MKRNYFVLSLILMFFGISASYAGVHIGDQVTDASALKDGSKILLRASSKEGTADPAQYKWMSSLKDSLVWAVSSMESPIDPYTPFVLEQAEEQIKGTPTFYVKNVKNGMYLTYLFEETVTNEDGDEEGSILINDEGNVDAQCRLDYTSDKTKASAFAFVLASTGVNWNINGPYTGTTQPDATSMMMFTVCKEYQDGELLLALNQAYSTPWAANYTDWGGWFEIYFQNEEIPVSYIEDLQTLNEKLSEIVYVGGTAPGCYDNNLVKEYDDAMKQASNAINVLKPDEATCEAAYNRLETAWLNLAVTSSNPVVPGYYMLKNASSSADLYRYMYGTSGQAKWINWKWDADKKELPNVYYVWELIDSDAGDFLMRNVGLNEYVSTTGGNGVTGSPTITLSRDSADNVVNFIDKGQAYFVIRQRDNRSLHAEATNTTVGSTGNLVAWDASDDQRGGASQWQFVMLPEDSVEYYKKMGDQLILDQALEELLAQAEDKYAIGNAFSYGVEDSVIVSPDQFLSNAAHMSTDSVYTNPRGVWGTGADGGGYAALLDGTTATYFHSAYAGTIAEEHYLDIDLKKELNTFVIAYSKRKGNDNNLPKSYEVYGAKAGADTSVVDNWTLIQSFTGQPLDQDTVYSPGIQAGDDYQYLRFLVKGTKNGATTNGFVFFALGGFQVYAAELSENCFNALNPDKATAFKTAITEAKAVEKGTTTQEDIDKLQAAYDAYVESLPDPTELKNAISEVESVVNSAIAVDEATEINGFMVYPDPGTYPVAAKAEVQVALDEAEEYITKNEATGSYVTDSLVNLMQLITKAKDVFLTKVRTINYADKDGNEGTWYHIAAANNYFKLTGTNSNEMRTGILYVKGGDGAYENSEIYWNEKDSIVENFGDNALWRFVQLTDSTYAIQNKGTQLYIGHKGTNPTYLTASPVGFELKSVGYGAYLFQGYRLDGEPVESNYLHSQVAGNLLVYWNSTNFGGSTWEIHNSDSERSESGSPVRNFRSKEFNFMNLQAGKLYAMCYPVGFEIMYDDLSDNISCYGVSAIDIENKSLTLAPLNSIEAGQPFFYLVGNNSELLKPNPSATDTVMVVAKISDFKNIAFTPQMVNGLIGEYSNVSYPDGMSALVETTETNDNGVVISRTQAIAAASGTTGWNSAYIKAGAIENLPEVDGSITVKIDGDIDTAIKDAIIDAQTGDVNVYTIDGVLVKKNVKVSEVTEGLAKGIYVVGNKKVVVK